jgi:ferredoxin like protein
MKPLSVPERLTKNRFLLDEEQCHIEVNQEIARATGTGKLLVACCPAHVYAEQADGTISVEYAACLECGTTPAAGSGSNSAKGSVHRLPRRVASTDVTVPAFDQGEVCPPPLPGRANLCRLGYSYT